MVAAGVVLALAVAGAAAAKDDDDHKFVLEFGTAGEWPLTNVPGNFGGTAAVEFTPIENWLEIEIGRHPAQPSEAESNDSPAQAGTDNPSGTSS